LRATLGAKQSNGLLFMIKVREIASSLALLAMTIFIKLS